MVEVSLGEGHPYLTMMVGTLVILFIAEKVVSIIKQLKDKR